MATYCGRFDDFAANHTGSAVATLDQLNQSLLAAVLVGDERLLINDGHLALHPALRAAVLDPAKSPLLELIKVGYVQILTRNQGQLDTLVPRMASDGITSAQRLLGSSQYKKTYKPALADWTQLLNGGGFPYSFHTWPTWNTTEIFRNIATSSCDGIMGHTQGAESKQLGNFQRRIAESKGRRTDWENIARALHGKGELSVNLYRSLMFMANEAYQYSWGCALQESNKGVRVDTEAPRYLSLDLTFALPEGQMRKAVKIYLPKLDLATSKVGTNWVRLAEMVRAGDATNLAKQRFRKKLEKYYASEEIDDAEMQKEGRAYSDALAEHFANTKRMELIFDGVVVNGTSTAAGAAIGTAVGPVGTLVGAGIGFAVGFVSAVGSTYWRAPHLLMKFRTKKDWIAPKDVPSANGVSSFEIDPGIAKDYLRGVSRFTR